MDSNLNQILSGLSQREVDIIKSRYSKNVYETLESISKRYSLSRERIRQIESNTIKKLSDKISKSSTSISVPPCFYNQDVNYRLNTLLVKLLRLDYKEFKLLEVTIVLQKKSYLEILDKLKEFNILSKNIPYTPNKQKLAKLIEIMELARLPENISRYLISILEKRKRKTDYIVEILDKAGYPMHFNEIYKLLPKEAEITCSRNVLAIMQRKTNIFVRLNNGLYALKGDTYSESVPFVKDLIVKYLKKTGNDTANNIYNYIITKRQTTYNSILFYLTLNEEFEEKKRGVFGLRESPSNTIKATNIKDLVNSIVIRHDQLPTNKLMEIIQRELPETDMSELYKYLSNSKDIEIANNFIKRRK